MVIKHFECFALYLNAIHEIESNQSKEFSAESSTKQMVLDAKISALRYRLAFGM